MRRRDETPAATAPRPPCCPSPAQLMGLDVHLPHELSPADVAGLCEHAVAELYASRDRIDGIRAGVGRGGT